MSSLLSRLSCNAKGLSQWLGFIASVCALSIIAMSLGDTDSALAIACVVIAGSAAIALSAVYRRPHWLATCLASASAIVITLYVVLGNSQAISSTSDVKLLDGHQIHALLCLALLFITLCAYRVHPAAYLPIPVAVGFLFWLFSDSWIYGLAAGLAVALVMALLNYFVQLLIDHQHEIAALPRRWFIEHNWTEIGRALYIWLFAFLFICTGLAVNQFVQETLHDATYRSGQILRDPDVAAKDRDRNLQRDVLYTINRSRSEDVETYERSMFGVRRYGDRAWEELPNQTEMFIESQRPGNLNSHAACRNAQTRVLRTKVSFRSLCRDIVNGVNGLIQSSFETTKGKLVALAEEKTEETQDRKNRSITEVQNGGIDAINAGYSKFERTIVAIFILLRVYLLIGYLAISCALIASIQLVLGRVLYHHSSTSARSNPRIRRKGPQRFCLDVGAAPDSAKKLDFDKAHELVLASLATEEFTPRYWYLSASTARKGVGTHMFLWVPQPLHCLFQRLFAGRLLMTRVAMTRKVRATRGNASARISVKGDCQLVPINIGPDQSVVFRMRDLAAFSDGVQIRSVYTTYVGAHFLGLGTFYCTAQGAGTIVLRSDGQQIVGSTRGTSLPAVNLLAWDRRSQFGLAQSLGIFGVWFNDPSIVTCSAQHSAIIDEGSATRFPLTERLWRLVRYLFIPV